MTVPWMHSGSCRTRSALVSAKLFLQLSISSPISQERIKSLLIYPPIPFSQPLPSTCLFLPFRSARRTFTRPTHSPSIASIVQYTSTSPPPPPPSASPLPLYDTLPYIAHGEIRRKSVNHQPASQTKSKYQNHSLALHAYPTCHAILCPAPPHTLQRTTSLRSLSLFLPSPLLLFTLIRPGPVSAQKGARADRHADMHVIPYRIQQACLVSASVRPFGSARPRDATHVCGPRWYVVVHDGVVIWLAGWLVRWTWVVVGRVGMCGGPCCD
ncbi:hypothetical protein IWX49DRAFT_76607 [Phyllosticta citricarpa]